MGYERLIQDLVEHAEKKKKEILESGHQESLRIISEAEAISRQLESEFHRALKRKLDQKRRRAQDRTKIEIRSILLEARVALVGEVLLRVRERLRILPSRRESSGLIERLFQEILAEIPPGPIIIRADKKVSGILQPLLKGKNVIFKPLPKEELGGFEIINQDDTVRIKNTFRARLEKAVPELSLEINRKILDYV